MVLQPITPYVGVEKGLATQARDSESSNGSYIQSRLVTVGPVVTACTVVMAGAVVTVSTIITASMVVTVGAASSPAELALS